MSNDWIEVASGPDVVVLVGLLAGVFLFFCVGIRGVAKGFGVGEAGAALVGLLAMGMSVWGHIRIQIGPEGWGAELTRRLEQVEATTEAVAETLPRIADEIDVVASVAKAVTAELPVLVEHIEYTKNLARALRSDVEAISEDGRPPGPWIEPPAEIRLRSIEESVRVLRSHESLRRELMEGVAPR